MSNHGGRGRGISNAPAWMANRQPSSGDGPSGSSGVDSKRARPSSPNRDAYGRVSRDSSRGGPYGDRDRDRGGQQQQQQQQPSHLSRGTNNGNSNGNSNGHGRSPPPPRHDHRRGPSRNNNRNRIYFQSLTEERTFVEERRRNRLARKTKFDIMPTPEQIAADAAAAAMTNFAATDFAGIPGNDAAAARPTASSFGTLSGSAQSQQTRHARRLYIGHLPPDVTEDNLHNFFRHAIDEASVIKMNEDPILSVYINHERRFCFLEFKTVEMTTACLALDDINIMGRGKVKIKRPNDYNPNMAPPIQPSALPQLEVSRLGIVSSTVTDGPNKLFVGGLHYHLAEIQVVELLSAFGKVRAFHLVKDDPDSITSKGYCFVEYMDSNVTPVAVMGLNGMDLGGGKTLTARIAAARTPGPNTFGNNNNSTNDTNNNMGGGGGVNTSTSIMTGGRNVINGYDVENLVDAAMGLVVMPPPPDPITGAPAIGAMGAMAGGNPPMMMSHSMPAALPPMPPPSATPMSMPMSMPPMAGQGNAIDIANAALEAAFGNSAAPGLPPPPPPPPQQQQPPVTRILVLHNMVTDEDLATNEDYEGLMEEVRTECSKFGNLLSMKVPRAQDGFEASSIRKIFLEYTTTTDAEAADKELSGRTFGPNVVRTTYFKEDEYHAGRLN